MALCLQLALCSPVLTQDSSLPRQVRSGLTPAKPLTDFLLTRWSVDEGLPTSALTDVLQTGDGYLWIASFNGLFRFDGVEFTVFDQRTVPNLETSGFYELAQDPEGNLWIGSQNAGVVVYRDGVFETLPAAPEPRLTVRKIYFDSTGTAWIGTTDFGAYSYRDRQWSPVSHPTLAGISVYDVLQDRSGAHWFATEGRGVLVLADGFETHHTAASGLASDAVTSLCEIGGHVWVGTRDGLSRISEAEIFNVDEFTGVEIRHLYRDDHGNLWIVAEQGLFRRNAISGEYERLRKPGGQPVRGLYGISFDREGALWLASSIDGLYQLKEGKFSNYSTTNGLSSERANAIFELTEGEFLIGGDGGKIDVIRDGAVEAWQPGVSLPDVRVRSFMRDRQGRFWISSYAGLLQNAGERWQWLTAENGLPTNQVRLTFQDSSGRFWIGTRNGGLIELLPGGDVRVLDRSSGLSSDLVLSITEGLEGELVVGTSEGVDILRPDGSMVSYGAAEGVPGGLVFSTFVDGDGAVWLCTNGGLARLYQGQVGKITVAEGLPVQGVFDYREDGKGAVWLSTTIGVVELPKQQLLDVLAGERQQIEAAVYDDRDGLVNKSCTGTAKMLRAKDGKLWVPTLGGVSVLDPGNLALNPVEPPVRISSLVVDGQPVDLQQAEDRVVVAPGSRDYAFGFAALSLLAPAKVKVRYRLRGFEDDWIDAGAKRTVRYTNLVPGDYAFEVIAANNDGIWNRDGAVLDLRVRPFLYQQPLFRIASVLLLTAAVIGLYRWRVRAVGARAAQLEKIVTEQQRTEKANRRLIAELEAKNAETERFNYTVSHDLKSPLVTILGFLGLLKEDALAGDRERMERDIEQIDLAAKRMAQLLEELLALAQAGRSLNEPQEVDLVEVAGQAVDQLTGEIEAWDAEVVIASDLPIIRGEPTRLLQLFQNLIQNAVRFAGDGQRPRVEVDWRQDAGEIVLFVRDHGIGIDPRYHEKIFLLFERLDPETEGTGVGLALVKRIVELHGGRIWVESAGISLGSTFCFTLPGDMTG